MNEDFNSNRPPDGEPDPLLEALRHRLGVGFGQEPPPELWAGIQGRLPAPAPRPWWLRARRLLPLLAGLLLVSLVLVRQATRSPLANHAKKSVSASHLPPVTSARKPHLAASSQHVLAPSVQPTAEATTPALTAPGASASRAAAPEAAGPAWVAALSHTARKQAANSLSAKASAGSQRLRNDSQLAAAQPKVTALASTSPPATKSRRVGYLLTPVRGARGQLATPALGRERLAARNSPAPVASLSSSRTEASASSPQHTVLASSADHSLATARRTRHRVASSSPVAALSLTYSTAASHRHQLLASPAENYITAVARQRKGRPWPREGSNVSRIEEPPAASELVAQAGKTDALTLRQARLLLAARPLPVPLAARPDSFAPHLAPVRRWAILAVAGPTLSYRTLPASNLAYSSSPAATAPVSSGTMRASTSYTDLEQPAAGWGAQVQVRRVLSGRWALALGLGYQEYATRISASGSNSLVYTASPSNLNGYDSTKTAGTLRDTYRLLTLPMQLSYALGPPHGRVALGLLGGLEPGWYLGGQSAEASSCHCQQQSFTAASTSPYNAFTLGVNLGLDVRLRLGAPASRWQLVLQPTGRYVATSFVRSTSIYARRQPYSLGVLAGVAWAFY